MEADYQAALGGRLRAIRGQQGLSLQAVEEKSDGRWKAVVVGSYERGDRAISVSKLAELADFYGVPVAHLLPESAGDNRTERIANRLVLSLERIGELSALQAGPLSRFVTNIQARRGDYNGRVITLRGSDLEILALLYDRSPAAMWDLLQDWQVIRDLSN
jgi:transcriptional regulator with XRE-family HTH domain